MNNYRTVCLLLRILPESFGEATAQWKNLRKNETRRSELGVGLFSPPASAGSGRGHWGAQSEQNFQQTCMRQCLEIRVCFQWGSWEGAPREPQWTEVGHPSQGLKLSSSQSRGEKAEKEHTQGTDSTADLNSSVSVITLNKNGLNAPRKRQRSTEWHTVYGYMLIIGQI